jgi:hypothetical protein
MGNRSLREPTLTILPEVPFNESTPFTLETGRCVALSLLEASGRFLETSFPGLDTRTDTANIKRDSAMEFALKPP